jgi:oxygen-dependent protoporphyrinogen oxidase
VVHLGYGESAAGGRPDGFGFLVPRGEGLRILGTIWSSSLFPGRAPPGSVLLTSMVGGAHDPEAWRLDDAALLALVRSDLERSMGIRAEPSYSRIFRHPQGIPQYTIGHLARLEEIERRLGSQPGLHVAGNSYRGISVNHCVDEVSEVAGRILSAPG